MYVLPAGTDLCRIGGHQFYVLHRLICAAHLCAYLGRHRDADELGDHDQNFSPDDAHDRHHEAHEPDDHDQNFSPDDLNYRGAGDHDHRDLLHRRPRGHRPALGDAAPGRDHKPDSRDCRSGAERQRLTLGFVLGEQMPQRAGDLQHIAVAIQIKMQADRRRAEVVRQFVGCGGGALEQAPEKLIAGGQNCRLERAVRCVGRLGTVPIPGSTRNGMI